ncbi:hypothetical protein GCM10009092_09200 [Bowmanella denitrificans]|uniref:DUF5655 domain-containing protein n=1 Tax=Bowmanella denitrificans TaxID=366582 RepID=A0ABP3GMK2_9ALTE
MADMQKALATQLNNIEELTGNSLDELKAIIKQSNLTKHTEIVKMLKDVFALGHGHANTLAHFAKESTTTAASESDPLDALYTGPKAALRDIHDSLLQHMNQFGPFDTAAKQKYVSYRRNKQFAMIGPATNTRVELGLNIKALPESPRLEKLPAGQMCQYRVKLSHPEQVDDEVIAWIKAAYDNAG